MKRFIKCLILFIISACVIFLCGCTIIKTDLLEYSNWNKITTDILNSDVYVGSLPDKSLVETYGKAYYYKYDEALFGDPQFVIFVTLEIPEAENHEKQMDFIRSKASITKTVDGQTFYFIRKRNYETDIAELYDEKINDGMYYDFEIVMTKEDGTISYLSAHVWDYYRDDVLDAFMQRTLLISR